MLDRFNPNMLRYNFLLFPLGTFCIIFSIHFSAILKRALIDANFYNESQYLFYFMNYLTAMRALIFLLVPIIVFNASAII